LGRGTSCGKTPDPYLSCHFGHSSEVQAEHEPGSGGGTQRWKLSDTPKASRTMWIFVRRRLTSDRDFLCKVFGAAIEAGAIVVNLPDTVGYAIPANSRNWSDIVMEHTPNMHKAILSVHCHNDLGWQRQILWLPFMRARDKPR